MAGDTGTMPAGGANDGQAIARQRIAACIATQAEELDLGGLQLTEIPGELVAAAESGQLRHLKRLFLAGNAAVRALDRDAVLAERHALQLILFDFSIKTPQSRILINRKSWNALSALPGALFTALDALEELDLAGNRLTELPASISNLTGLTDLDLADNRIGAEGARALAALTGLTHLNLADNSIGDEGARALAALTGLTSLNLADNGIGDEGARALAALTGLTSLNLGSNDIGAEGARALAALTGLTHLNLGSNGIELWSNGIGPNSIGDEGARALATLTGLTSLTLADNGIGDEGARALAALTGLTHLDLRHNGIGAEGARALAALTGLTHLNLDGNCIGAEGARALAALTGLTHLNLANNFIGAEGARALTALTGLTHLNLRLNDIGAEGARALAALTGLTSLYLMHNGKIEIDALTALPKLQQITLDNCEIGNVCAEFWYKPSLRQVSLQLAKLGDVPGEIIEGDNPLAKLRAHLRDLAAGAELLSDVKFMILGNGRIGKTQICRRLRGDKFDETVDSTHGIFISEAFISEATLPQQNADGGTNGNDMPIRGAPTKLKLWDFGGQDIYLGTHALFLKSRALFPIVWTPASEKRSEHTHNDLTFRNYPLDYWVQYVGQMADKASPVILIQNQVDEPGPPGRPPVSKALLDRFAWHERIDYSAKTKNGHPTLIDTLNQAVAYLRKTQGEQRIGVVRAAVKRRLEAMQLQAQAAREARPQAGEPDLENAWITKTAFDAMCAEEGGVESTDLLLEYLHQIGTVFYRKDLFDGRIVIDQQWALDAIYAVFERNSGAYRYLRDIRGGRFIQSELAAHVWSRLGHGHAEQELFISMMRSCGICFKLHDGDDSREAEYVAPDLLPPRDQIAGLLVRDWDDSDQATEHAAFTYALLPPGLMRSLMAKIGEDAGTRADYWQDGFYFYDNGTRSRARVEQIRAEDDGESGWSGRIEVRTQAADAGAGGESNGPRELLRRLCQRIDETQNRHGVTTSEFSGPKWYERLLQPGKAARRHSTLRAAAYGRAILDAGDTAEAGVGLMSAPPGMPVSLDSLDERGQPQPP